jgi:hypothetical protein
LRPGHRRLAAGGPRLTDKVEKAHARSMLLGDLLHHGQTESGALGLGGDIRFERTLEDLLTCLLYTSDAADDM